MNGASLEASARPCAVMYMPCATAYTRLAPNRFSQFTKLGLCQLKGTMQVVITLAVIIEREHDVRRDHQTDGCRIHDAPMRGGGLVSPCACCVAQGLRL